LNNNQARLFFIGLFIGMAMTFCVVGYQAVLVLMNLDHAEPATQTSRDLPSLILLEETNIPRQTIRTSAPSTAAIMFTETPAISSATPLWLFHEQQPEEIGYSLEGRPLQLYIFGNGEHQRLIVADIHGGDEWNTLTLANQLIQYLNQYPDVVPDDVTLYILPTLNPDGEARAHDRYGRLNHNGVDLNRNFPVNWRADWERAGCWNSIPSSGGTGPGSEAETQALMDFITRHDIEALISYHSAALGIFPGGDPWDENSIRLAESIAHVSTYSFPPLDTGCAFSGTLPDYAVSQGIAAVDLELTNHIETDFDMNLDVLQELFNWE
jgi:hypothetical protein